MKACEVKIFGHSYSLRADVDEGLVVRTAQLVDSRMRDVAASSPSASALQVAVLAAMGIASEHDAQENVGRISEAVDQKVENMLRMLDKVDPDTKSA